MNKVVEKILSDTESKGLFLRYMKMHYQQRQNPESIPENASKEEKTKFLKAVWDLNKSMEALVEHLQKKYNLQPDYAQKDSLMNQIIIEVCKTLEDTLGQDAILKMPHEAL